MAVNGRLYPVDGLLAAFNLAMAGLWMRGVGGWGHAPALVLAHVAAAGLPWLLRAPTPLSPVGAWLRRLYPMVWLLAFWTEVDLVRKHLHTGANDAFIIALEESLIGVHLHEIWMPRMHGLWLSEALHFSYFAYYAALVVPVLWLARGGRDRALMDTLFRMMTTFGTCFLLFALFPVDGPQHTGPVFQGPNARGPFARLVELTAGGHGESLGAAFPSSHVAGAVTMAWIARLHLPRWAFGLLVLEAVGVFLSTFYTQQHYAIDSVAGAALALVVQGGLVPATLSRLARPGPPAVAVPPLVPERALLRLSRKETAA